MEPQREVVPGRTKTADVSQALAHAPLDAPFEAVPDGVAVAGRRLTGPQALALEALARAGVVLTVRDLLELTLAGVEVHVEARDGKAALALRTEAGQPVPNLPPRTLARVVLEEARAQTSAKGWAVAARRRSKVVALYRRDGWTTWRQAAFARAASRLVEAGALYPCIEVVAGGRSLLVPLLAAEETASHRTLEERLGHRRLPPDVRRQIGERREARQRPPTPSLAQPAGQPSTGGTV